MNFQIKLDEKKLPSIFQAISFSLLFQEENSRFKTILVHYLAPEVTL